MNDYIDNDRVEAHCEHCDCVIEYPEESVAWKAYGLCERCLFEAEPEPGYVYGPDGYPTDLDEAYDDEVDRVFESMYG